MESDGKIFDTLCALPELQAAHTVYTYLSISREVDTRCLIHFCLDKGKRIALPVCKGDGRMIFRLYDRRTTLVPAGPYNIPEPPVSARYVSPAEGDVIIVPAMCYNDDLYRMGHGMGYYDRFLADCPATAIGLCREQLIMPDLPIESHDRKVDLLITEEKMRGR